MRAATHAIAKWWYREVIAVANSVFVCIDTDSQDKRVFVAVPSPNGKTLIL